MASPAAALAACTLAALSGSALTSVMAACAWPRPNNFSPASFTKSMSAMVVLWVVVAINAIGRSARYRVATAPWSKWRSRIHPTPHAAKPSLRPRQLGRLGHADGGVASFDGRFAGRRYGIVVDRLYR